MIVKVSLKICKFHAKAVNFLLFLHMVLFHISALPSKVILTLSFRNFLQFLISYYLVFWEHMDFSSHPPSSNLGAFSIRRLHAVSFSISPFDELHCIKAVLSLFCSIFFSFSSVNDIKSRSPKWWAMLTDHF